MLTRITAFCLPVLTAFAAALAQEVPKQDLAPPAGSNKTMMIGTIFAIILILSVVAVSMKKSKREHRD